MCAKKPSSLLMVSLGKQIETSRVNNLNAIRLMLALAVIVCHAYVLSLGWENGWEGKSNVEPLNILTHHQEQLGSVAVDLFFFISGMLITASWLRSKSMQEFLMKRVLRIYPGFIVAVAFSGAVVLVFCPDFRAGIGHGISWMLEMIKDWTFLSNNSLQGRNIFAGNPFPNLANGSLWTIPIEFGCYTLVAVIGLLCLFKHRMLVLMATAGASFIYSVGLHRGEDVSHQECRFLTYFLLGMCAWLWRDRIPFSKWLLLGCLGLLAAASQFKPWFSVLFPYLGSYCVLWLGYGVRIAFLAWTQKTDLSYGTYLYACPIQQLVAMHESLRYPLLNFVIATPLTLLLAFASWHLVEKRFLAMKNVPRTDFDPGAEVEIA
ncbi:MAG: acyltransferase [Verrucomicrobiota bacterium]